MRLVRLALWSLSIKDKYAWALWQLGRRKEAGELADLILAKDPANKIALEIKRLLAEPEYPLLLHLNYSFDHFDEPYYRWWHLYSVGLSEKFEGYTISGKLNIGHLHPIPFDYRHGTTSLIGFYIRLN